MHDFRQFAPKCLPPDSLHFFLVGGCQAHESGMIHSNWTKGEVKRFATRWRWHGIETKYVYIYIQIGGLSGQKFIWDSLT